MLAVASAVTVYPRPCVFVCFQTHIAHLPVAVAPVPHVASALQSVWLLTNADSSDSTNHAAGQVHHASTRGSRLHIFVSQKSGHPRVLRRSLPHLTLTTSSSSPIFATFSPSHPSPLAHDPVYPAKIHGRVADQHESHLSQIKEHFKEGCLDFHGLPASNDRQTQRKHVACVNDKWEEARDARLCGRLGRASRPKLTMTN